MHGQSSNYRKKGPGRRHRQGDGSVRGGPYAPTFRRLPIRVVHSGKLNFRRSDPRHPMYDALRERGWVIRSSVPGGGLVAERVVKDGIAVGSPAWAFAVEHAKDRSVRIPACLWGAA